MKIRSDFVTNSSSSSFIIDRNKYDGELTDESVFQKIKTLHKEYSVKLRAIVKYLSKRGIELRDGRFYDKNGKDIWLTDLADKLRKELENKFDVEPWWLFDHDCFDTYKTYEDYKNDGHCSEIGFSIVDYRQEGVEMGYDAYEVLLWYSPDLVLRCFAYGRQPDCVNCDEAEWCSTLDFIAAKREENGNANLSVHEIARQELLKLGSVCVHSLDGNIDFNVARQLAKLCSHYCFHMG